MHRVLIVDDEPIILSGIRHLIDWSAYDAEIAGSAVNGEEAYRIICSEHPDIVITDIRMPIMDGLALAGRCSEEFPDIVFIVLTSLAEFSLAKEAIGYGISDYLLKTELDEEKLGAVLLKAEEGCRLRRGGSVGDAASGRDDRVADAISSLMIMRGISQETKSLLSDNGLLDGFALAAVAFSFPAPSLEKQWSPDDYLKLRDWERDVVGKMLPSFFGTVHSVVPVSGKNGTFIYFLSGLSPDTWQAVSSRASERIAAASAMVTGLEPAFLTTPVMEGRDGMRKARDILERSLAAYYLDKDPEAISLSPLDIDATFPKLEAAIRSKEIVGCRACFSALRSAIQEIDHSLSQFEFAASALRSAMSSGLSALGLGGGNAAMEAFESVDFITKRSEALEFIDDCESSLLMLLDSKGGSGKGVADRAREYVMQHVMEKITLGDVADHACVSLSYMSKSFKRIMGISLVDYINSTKVEKAKEMMQEGKGDRIADIALSLGFTNIYYFSKVFRKVEGIPPTEYIRKLAKA